MTLELNQTRVGSSSKIRTTYERRAEQNARFVDLLHEHSIMWNHVHGIAPEKLFRPRAADIELAKQACTRLLQLAESDGRDGLPEFAEEAVKGVELLASLEWEDIRIEKYSLTPPGVFSELVRLAETQLYRQASEAQRRQRWLSAQVGDAEAHAEEVAPSTVDRHGLDLEFFKNKTGRRPKDWNKACQVASWVLRVVQIIHTCILVGTLLCCFCHIVSAQTGLY
jgi:hypothetical protein